MQVSDVVDVFLTSLFLALVIIAAEESILMFRKDVKFDSGFLVSSIILSLVTLIVILLI